MIFTSIKKTAFTLCLLASPLAFSALAETAGQEIERASQLNTQASALYQQGKYQKAIELLQQSLAINEKALGSEDGLTAYSLNNLAVVYDALGLYEQAMPLYQRALAIREKVLGTEHTLTATSLNNLALLYKFLGQYDQALPLFQRALVILEKTLGPEHSETAATIDNLAALYESLGQYDKAMPLYLRAKAILEKYPDANPQYTTQNLDHLAGLYGLLGQNDQALPLLQRALAINDKSLGPEHPLTAYSINSLALLYQAIGQYEQALTLYTRAWAIYGKATGVEHQRFVAANLNNLALLYEDLGQYDKALPLLQLALEINEKFFGSNHTYTAQSLDSLAKFYWLTKQPELALPLLYRAYSAAMFSNVPEMLKLVQAHLADFYASQGNPSVEIFYLKGAVNTTQSIRTESRGLDKHLQKSLLSKNEGVYNRLANLLIDAGRLTEAQQVLSMLKEEEYFDFIQRDANADTRSTRLNYSNSEKPISDRLDKLGNEGAALVEQLNALNKQAKLSLTPAQEKQRTKIKTLLAEQTKQTIALLSKIPQQHPANNQSAKQSQQFQLGQESLSQLRATLTSLGHGAVLLQYLVTDTRVRIILTTSQVQLARDADVSSKELNRKIAALRRVLQNPALDPRPQAQALYKLLITPVANDLKKAHAQTLMLSLDGSLRYLPMAALHDGEAYLAERYSLAMYTEVAKDKLRQKPADQWKVAGLGITRKIGEFSPLPSVQQEMDGIIYIGTWKATGGVLPGEIYLDKEFTQARFHDVLDRAYPVLHIASHFVFIPGTEAQSFLLLGDGKQLSLAELRTGGWKFASVDMMTLSACETALGGGHDENGREIEGFGALAQRQGAKGVLATLWPVADQSTAILMQNLYRLRQERGLTKADALREAQLLLITGKHTRPEALRKTAMVSSAGMGDIDAPVYIPDPAKPFGHPYYWAPFILMGNWL